MATASMPSALAACKIGAHGVEIGLVLDRAVGAHALVDFGDALIEQFRLDDFERENFRPRLIADLERVAETLGDQQQRAVALALQQRVGGDRGAHLDRADLGRRDRLAGLEAQQIANALHGGVGIGLRIFRQQLVRGQLAVRPRARPRR